MYDTIVVGGGVVGASVAYHLARADADVLLVDRDDPGKATDVAAGILSPATSTSVPERIYRFTVDAVEYYSSLLATLDGQADRDEWFERCGLVIVGVSEDERTTFERTREDVRDRSERFGHPSADAVREPTAAGVTERVPVLSGVQDALSYVDAARVCGGPLTRALVTTGESYGLKTLEASVERVVVDDGNVAGVGADGEVWSARNVVVAGGAWSGAFADQLGIDPAVEPLRGQVVHLDPGDVDASDWPIVTTAARDHYLVPWPDGRVVAASTVDPGTGFDVRTTAAGVHGLLEETLRIAPGLADATVVESRVGLRPKSADDLPVVGAVPGYEGAYVATGHGSLGLVIGPYTGKLVADEILGRPAETDLSALSPERFA